MRELTYVEKTLIAGGQSDCSRNQMRESFVEMSLVAAPFVGYEIGKAATIGMGLGYGLGGMVVGVYATIVALPVITKVGLELAFGVHDILV